MTVVGRLGALFLVLGGAALLLVDGLRSPPGLWYAAASIAAGTTMALYPIISSPSPRRPQLAPEPASPNTSEESTTGPPTRQTDSQSADTEQTAESTGSTKQDPEPASDNDLYPPQPLTSEEPEPPTSEQPELLATTVKKQQSHPADTGTTHRTTSNTGSSQTRKTARTFTHRQRHVTSTASPRRNPSAETDNPYFKPVDSSREIKFVQVDTKFSYLDIDWGPELIGLDPIPDLVEVDVGPSAASHELVHSPVEIKISSFLKALLTPTPHSSGTAASNDSTRPSTAPDNHARRRTDDTATRRRSAPRDTWETRHLEQDRRVDCRREPLTAADRRQHPAETWPRSSGPEPENHRPTTADTTGYGSREEISTFDGGRSSTGRSLGPEPIIDEEPIGPQDEGVADESAFDVGIDYSPPRWEPPQLDSDPFGLTDVTSEFSELEESAVEPVEQPEFGLGMSGWGPGVLIEEPVMDPEIGAEMLGLDGFAESPEGAVDLPGLNVKNGSNPLFPEAESVFPEEDAEDDWLTF
ncbi:hypothetical protein ACFR97_16375 [Haloplanus litoreus]|uniref:Transmembrane protein n=1 Tax=Haloplanus litoreus TaxID=767515 RepID=A0ABD6A2P1_9EURY